MEKIISNALHDSLLKNNFSKLSEFFNAYQKGKWIIWIENNKFDVVRYLYDEGKSIDFKNSVVFQNLEELQSALFSTFPIGTELIVSES